MGRSRFALELAADFTGLFDISGGDNASVHGDNKGIVTSRGGDEAKNRAGQDKGVRQIVILARSIAPLAVTGSSHLRPRLAGGEDLSSHAGEKGRIGT